MRRLLIALAVLIAPTLRAQPTQTTRSSNRPVDPYKIAGPVGSMGQRVLQPIINQQVGNVLASLDAEVQEAKAAAG